MNNKFLFLATLLFVPSLVFGHARLVSPAPRNNNAGIKVGPCGNVPRGTDPTVWTVGQTVTVNWEETIDHPGKFLFSISPANDVGFDQNLVKMVLDDQNAGVPLPHQFTTTFTVPNITCDNCTFQMVQSMEEDPNNPTFYYSCADIKIVEAPKPPEPPPTGGDDDGGQSSQSSKGGAAQPEFGGYGCGTVGPLPPGGGAGGATVASILLLLMTLATYVRLRRPQRVPVYARRKYL